MVASILMIAAVVVMSTYVRRALQARAHDAQRKIMADVNTQAGLTVNMEYEPYYTISYSNVDSYQRDSSYTHNSGMVDREINMERGIKSVSNQLQPAKAD